MTQRATEILNAALQLSEAERAELIEVLEESLDGPDLDTDHMTDEEFEAELNRRHEEYLRDPNVAVPWEEVLRETLAEHPDVGPITPPGQG